MPHGLRRFKHGGVVYPLTSSTTNTALEDGDPALHYALSLFETVIEEYVGERLLAQAAIEGLNFPSAVAKAIHYEPSPFLQAHEMEFPLLALYRTEEMWSNHTAAFDKSVSVWSWAYVFPPMGPREIDKLDPLLKSVAVVVSTFAMQSFDPSWEDGQTLRDLSGIQKMEAGPVKYMDFEPIDGGQNKWWRAVTGKLIVAERADIVFEDLDVFEGVSTKVDLAEPEGTVASFVEVETHLPPIIAQILPASGTKAGAAYFEILGTGFRPGTPARVLIGGSYASSVYVASPFKVTGLTPEHDAHPTFPADVQVFDVDGSASNVLEGAYTFTTP
jgi:hypothetical protein